MVFLFLTPDHNMPVFRASMSAKEAFRLQDLVTLENEDYPDLVSVISVGMPIKSITKIDEPGYLPITITSFYNIHPYLSLTERLFSFSFANSSSVSP